MNRTDFTDHIRKTYDEALQIVEAKNKDYGADSNPFKNFTLVDTLGVTDPGRGIMVRLCDKFARLTNLLDKPPTITSESFDDTLIDMINYLAILRAWRAHEAEQKTAPASSVLLDDKVNSNTSSQRIFSSEIGMV